MATVTADLNHGLAVELRAGDHVWRADEPTDLGGSDSGPNPYELLLGALGACTAITVAAYCRRKGWPFESISAHYEIDRVHADDCDLCDEAASGFVERIRSEIFIEGSFDAEQRERLSEIAQRCPVHKTLDHGVTFTTEAVIVG